MLDRGRAAPSADAPLAGTPLGIVACAGTLPIAIARAVTAAGRPVHLAALEGIADGAITAFPHDWIRLGQVGRLLASLRGAGCRELVIAGAMRRPNLLRLSPDWGLVRHLATILSLTRGGDDSVLRRIVGFFEAQGFVVRGVGDVAPALLAPAGALAVPPAGPDALAAMARAARAIDALGSFDIGQAVVATAGGLVAVEGVRGTDAMLEDLGPGGSGAGQARHGVLVKLAKPGQELRVDLPTIGPRTVERAVAAGLAGIAVDAGRAIVLEREALAKAADAAGLFVIGITRSEMASAGGQPRPQVQRPAQSHVQPSDAPGAPLAVLSRRAPTPAERRDIAIARRLAPVLARERAGAAALIASEHVLAVSGGASLVRMLAMLQGDSQWGRRSVRRQLGTLLVNLGAATGEDGAVPENAFETLLGAPVREAVEAARVCGVVCLGDLTREQRQDLVAWAKAAKIFLLSDAEEPDVEA